MSRSFHVCGRYSDCELVSVLYKTVHLFYSDACSQDLTGKVSHSISAITSELSKLLGVGYLSI
jgi:hypothetical protein